MAVIELDAKHGVRKRLSYRALDFNNIFFCHVLTVFFPDRFNSMSFPIDSKYEALRWIGRRSYAQSEQIDSHLP